MTQVSAAMADRAPAGRPIPSAPPQWRIAPGAAPIWRQWDGEYLLHHALSNDTHRVSTLAGLLVEQLQAAGPRSPEQLGEALDADPDLVLEVLSALEPLDFVCRC